MKIEYFNSDRQHEMIKFIAEMLKVEPIAVKQAIDAFEAEYPESNGFSISDIFDENERSSEPYPLDKNNPDHIDIARAAVISIGSDFELHDSDWLKVDEAIDAACKEAGLVKSESNKSDEDDDDDWGEADEDDRKELNRLIDKMTAEPKTSPDLRYFEGDNKNDYE